MNTESVETQEKKPETLEEATMEVLKEQRDWLPVDGTPVHRLLNDKYEIDPDRRRALFIEWKELVSAESWSNYQDERITNEKNRYAKMLGLSEEFIKAYEKDVFDSANPGEPPDEDPGP